jgi:hypothetical protein
MDGVLFFLNSSDFRDFFGFMTNIATTNLMESLVATESNELAVYCNSRSSELMDLPISDTGLFCHALRIM